MYYNYNRIRSYNAYWNFVISNRGGGKTYGFKEMCIKDFLKKGEQFIYVRRTKVELEDRQTFFDDIREKFERRLEPDSLEGELIRYKEVFGEEFGLKELLTLQDLRVKALIAEAINNVPEFLLDQIGKARNSYEFPSLVTELGRIADVMEEVVEGEGE